MGRGDSRGTSGMWGWGAGCVALRCSTHLVSLGCSNWVLPLSSRLRHCFSPSTSRLLRLSFPGMRDESDSWWRRGRLWGRSIPAAQQTPTSPICPSTGDHTGTGLRPRRDRNSRAHPVA